MTLLWIEKFVHKCYKEDDKADKFLSESCCDYGDDHERLLVNRDDEEISSPRSFQFHNIAESRNLL